MPLLVCSGLLLSGCSDTSNPRPTPVPFVLPSTPAIAAATAAPLIPKSPLAYESGNARARPIVWASSIVPATGGPGERVASFPTTAANLYAVVPFEYIARGVSIRADWSYNNTAMPTLTSSSMTEATQTDLWIAFHLARNGATPWPDGEYQLTVLLDGQPALTSTVHVESPSVAE